MNKKLQFYLRRLHGITGIFPVGYFLLYHLREGASFSSSGMAYGLLLLWLPLLFHSLYGIFITYEGSMNICSYGYLRNYMYFLQRLTGIFIFIFLIGHVYLMKTGSFENTLFYNFFLFSGVVLAIFHFANGFFGFLIDMGATVGEKAQKVAVALSFVAFVIFAAYGIQKFFNFIQ